MASLVVLFVLVELFLVTSCQVRERYGGDEGTAGPEDDRVTDTARVMSRPVTPRKVLNTYSVASRSPVSGQTAVPYQDATPAGDASSTPGSGQTAVPYQDSTSAGDASSTPARGQAAVPYQDATPAGVASRSPASGHETAVPYQDATPAGVASSTPALSALSVLGVRSLETGSFSASTQPLVASPTRSPFSGKGHPQRYSRSSDPLGEPPTPGNHHAGSGTRNSSLTRDVQFTVGQSGNGSSICGSGNSTAHLNSAGSSGRIEWTGNGSSRALCLWSISVSSPRAMGLVLHFEEVNLQRGEIEDDIVTVYQGLEPLQGMEQGRAEGSLPVPAILIYSNHALVHLSAHMGRSAGHVSHIALNYSAYPVETLPPRVDRKGPAVRYNCSPPYIVPQALRCDLAEQCVDGQDERNFHCAHQHPDCEDCIVYDNVIFKFVFPEKGIKPFEARHQCLLNQRSLGELPAPAWKRMAARVMSLSGYKELVVNLVKYENEPEPYLPMYRFMWRWYVLRQLELGGPLPHTHQRHEECATLLSVPSIKLRAVSCHSRLQAGYVCMSGTFPFKNALSVNWNEMQPYVPTLHQSVNLQTCSDGSLVQMFHSCPIELSPFVKEDSSNSKVRSFSCRNKREVRYTVLCDGFDDCRDYSDEINCDTFRRTSVNVFVCRDKQNPISVGLRCNGQANCFDGSDEKDCIACANGLILDPTLGCLPQHYIDKHTPGGYVRQKTETLVQSVTATDSESGLKVLHMDGYGLASVNTTTAAVCPENHFLCHPDMCIPSYLINNEMLDCQNTFADERVPIRACPGLYRCYAKPMCIDPLYLCDDVIHCPSGDDELFCNWTCPAACECEGLEYTCQSMFDPGKHPTVRYLDLSGVRSPPLVEIDSLIFLVFLNLSSCGLRWVDLKTRQLTVLDLSYNELTTLNESSLSDQYLLRHLHLSGNPLYLHLAENSLSSLLSDYCLQRLSSLGLSNTSIQKIDSGAFSNLNQLLYLDLSLNPIEEFTRGTFQGLDSLDILLTDDQRLCCLYESEFPQPITCSAPVDELSSCSDLLGSTFLRATLWLQSVMAVVGNAGVLIFRIWLDSESTSPGFRVLVINLSVSDLFMGVYLILIGTADSHYSGQYVWNRTQWLRSVWCQASGFLSFLSSEVSVFIICLITLDRFLVLRFPFRGQLHMKTRSASALCGVAWFVGVLLAAIPLLPTNRHWEFYSQTGICLPLPVTRHQFPGQAYSFSIFIVLNCALFVLIAAGQLAIYLSIGSHVAPTSRNQRREQDMVIARRLFLIVFTDFCCWFPVGVTGLLAARGMPVPGLVSVWAAVFVLPFNSAVNPFLYTLNTMLERRRKRREEQRIQTMLNRLHVDILTWPKDRVMQFSRCCSLAVERLGDDAGGDGGASAYTQSMDQEEEMTRITSF